MKIHCKYDELVEISSLKPHPKNRNKHPAEQISRLAKILKYQGCRAPVVAIKKTRTIMKGHGTTLAAAEAGEKKVPVVWQTFESKEQEYAFLQSDNAIASWAELEFAEINTDLEFLGPDFDIDLLGIKNFTIDVAEKGGGKTDPDDAPEPPKHPKTRPGDLYRLGRHRLLCGDATLTDHVERLMGGELADLVWTDPPYNVAYEGKTKEALTIKNDKMEGADFLEFLTTAMSNMMMATKPGGGIYLAHADSEGLNFRRAMTEGGWMIKQCLIWVKQTLVMGRQDYHWRHEPILYGWKEGAAHTWLTDRKQTTVLEFNRPSRNAEHPTMKPVDLVQYCIGNSCALNGVVLDLFGGSGTTLIAAEQLKRRAFLCELDPKYCDVIVARWEAFTGNKAELVGQD